MPVIVSNVSFSYGSPKKPHHVLQDVSFEVNDGEMVAILGANGVGKSTLFKCILGILKGYEGIIRIDDEDASLMTAKRLSRKIAYIPQIHYPSFNYSVLNMVLMGTGSRMSAMSAPGQKQIKESMDALDKFGIASLAERDYVSLSGGEQQLVLMARALVQSAGIWILDEPVASLDFGNQILVQEQLRKMVAEGYTIIMSSHNPEQTYMYADRIVAMKDGRVLKYGSPKDIMNEELIHELYGIDVKMNSLCEDKIRVCIPNNIATR